MQNQESTYGQLERRLLDVLCCQSNRQLSTCAGHQMQNAGVVACFQWTTLNWKLSEMMCSVNMNMYSDRSSTAKKTVHVNAHLEVYLTMSSDNVLLLRLPRIS